ncbi:ankyrin repeat domain-containing protein [uncultured Campylobacter sp.]|uniref:ankyrin repeat domain-containing protein n=1 Tax=uncultured Campylobacter sp. TaxID=218934 RepID=UPI002638E6C7|nr:ankyrin repeat domain-containing protein [uncultured Campylobacter sp.]
MQSFFKSIFTIAAFAAILFYLSFLGVKFGKFGSSSMPTGFTVTPDTKIDPNSELAKYVTQEEIEAFGFGSSDIVCDKEKNATLVPLRAALDRKDIDFVVKFIKDNNLTADVSMRDKRTPLMYSSFRNDVNTSNALINLGADIRAKDRFGLSPMAYAIMLNSVDTAKILLEKGVKFEEVEYVAYFILDSKDNYEWISTLTIDDDNITINYKVDPKYPDTDINNPACVERCTKDKVEPFKYVVSKKLSQMAELMLSTGYKPKEFKMGSGLQGIKDEEKNRPLQLSGWAYLGNYENYEPMLEVFIKYDLPNAPTKEQLKEAYEECYKENQIDKNFYKHYEYNKKRLDEITISQGETPTKVNPVFFNFRKKLRINHYEKHCPDENSTFTIREFIDWANDNKKNEFYIKFYK